MLLAALLAVALWRGLPVKWEITQPDPLVACPRHTIWFYDQTLDLPYADHAPAVKE